MPIGYSNLDPSLQSKLQAPDVGQIYYVVDSDFRTAAQGWSQVDRTGPLDLYEARKAGKGGTQYVYRTGDYTSDAVCLQSGIDAMVDFRGDTLFFTPGNPSIATALVINVPDARWLGAPVSYPTLAKTTLTAAVAAAFGITAAADRMEFGYLQFVPLTAATMFDAAALTGLHVHDTFYNADGIAASTATINWVLATAAEFATFESNYVWVDGAQGPWIRCAGIVKGLRVADFQIFLEAGTWAAAIDLAGVGAADYDVGPGSISGGGTALTSLVTVADKTKDTTHGYTHGVRSSTVGPAATALSVAVNAAEADIVDCWRAVATDTASPNFTSGGVITWESGVPFTG